MALPSAFQERLRQMDESRSQRLALLQAERQIQVEKSRILSSKIDNHRRMEQRCLILERRDAELGFLILAKKSEIDEAESRYERVTSEIRVLKDEIRDLEEREKARDKYYAVKTAEMEEFNERKRIFVAETGELVRKLKESVSQLKSTLKELQSFDKCLHNAEIVDAEARHAKLLYEKEKLEKQLASSCQLRSLLRKQLQKMLMSNERKNIPPSDGKNKDQE